MRPSSQLFADTITGSHLMVAQVTAQFGTGTSVDVPISDGSVSQDRTRLVRRQCTLTVPGRDWVASSADADWPLSPYGGELTISRGVRWPDSTEELIQLGVFVIQGAPIDRGQGQVEVSGDDRYSRLVDDRFEAPRKPPALTLANGGVVQTIRNLIQETIPGITVTQATGVTNVAYNGRTTYEEDRAQAVADLAKSIGCEVYANALGTFTISPIPNLDTPPVGVVASGPGGVLVGASTDLTREGVYNTVVARSEPADPDDPVITVTVRDTKTASVTKHGGPFGKKPRFYTSPLLTTETQARNAARGILADSIGQRSTIDWEAVPDPRFEVSDVIIIAPPEELGEAHILDTLDIPLTVTGSMTGGSRAAEELEEE